jgi:putative hemolysin
MALEDWIAILGIAICTTLLAYAVASEAALSGISRVRLRALAETEPQRVERLNQVIEMRQSHISGAELTSAVSLLVASALIGRTAARLTGGLDSWAVVVVASAAVVLLGVTLPRTAASYDPERMALNMIVPLSIMHAIGDIVLIPFLALSRLILRLLGRRPVSRPSGLEEEVLALFNSEDEVEPPEEEQEMIESLVEFHATLVREVMVPRTDIVAVASDATMDEVLDEVLDAGYSRLPVYEETIDQVKGILHAKDLLRVLRQGTDHSSFNVMSLIRPALFVPESKKVDDLLREMQQGRTQIAIIFDEYGGTAGLVTIEDLLEEIVGEIQDEYDEEELAIEKLGAGDYMIDARVPLDDVNEELGVNWAAEDYDSLGGLVYDRLGRIPVVGDSLTVDGVRIVVESAEGRRLRKLHLTVVDPIAEQAARDEAARQSANGSGDRNPPADDGTSALLGSVPGGMPGGSNAPPASREEPRQ